MEERRIEGIMGRTVWKGGSKDIYEDGEGRGRRRRRRRRKMRKRRRKMRKRRRRKEVILPIHCYEQTWTPQQEKNLSLSNIYIV